MSSILRTRHRDKVKANVIRQFVEGFTTQFIATANRITQDTVSGIIDKHSQQVHGAAGLMRIGELAPRKVRPYECDGCNLTVDVKPCVKCAADQYKKKHGVTA